MSTDFETSFDDGAASTGASRRSARRSRGRLTTLAMVGALLWMGSASLEATELPSPSVPPAPDSEVGTISGEVRAAGSGQPLVSVQVAVIGSGIGTITGPDGGFVLENIPAGEHVLRAQLLGYRTVQESVHLEAGQNVTVDLTLSESAIGLDEIVVTGTAGQARRREVGNQITQINMAEVQEPVASMDQLLQGRSTGMTVTSHGGAFGGGAAIRLRGNVSLSMSNQPLIFIDGVRQSAEGYPVNNTEGDFPHYGSSSQMSPLNEIHPGDIERIEIVKGAAATTLYGSEASAGVIQIFTRQGASGSPQWTFQSDHGVDWVRPFGSSQRPYVGMEPFLRNAYGTQNSLSASGGLGAANYYLSGVYEVGDGVLPNDHQDRVGLRANLSLEARSDLLLQLHTAYSRHALDITHTGNSAMAIPFSVFRAPNNAFGTTDPEVIRELTDAKIWQDNDRFLTSLTAVWEPNSRTTQRATVGLDRSAFHGRQHRPLGFNNDPQGSMSDTRWESRTITLDYTGNYTLLQDPSGEAVASTLSWGLQGTSTEESKLDGFGRGFPGPGRHTLSNMASGLLFSSEQRRVSGGFFGQSMVAFRDRVFVTAGARVDGHSVFGENLGLQTYPKLSASWVISDEALWPESWGDVKLRAAYGLAGRAPGAFDAVQTWTAHSFGGAASFIPENVGNPELGPEKTRETEVGFDGSWLNGRLAVDFTFYHQDTRDALFAIAQPPTQGFLSSQLENVGALSNRGLELSVDGRVMEQPGFTWNLGANLSTNRSEVLDIGTATVSSIVEGHPAPVMRGAYVRNADAFEDPDIDPDHFYGPNAPTRIVGLNTSLDFRNGVSLSARGEYQGGHYIRDGTSHNMVNRGAGAPGCDDAYEHVPYSDYPQGDLSQVTALDRARCYRESLLNGMWNIPADFFKVREITLHVPATRVVPGARTASLTFSLRNAFRWTNDDFPSFDPEMIPSRDSLSSLFVGITEHVPDPARVAVSLRVTF